MDDKVIDIDKEYCIYPGLIGKLRHRCGYNTEGRPFSFFLDLCMGCDKRVPDKIWFIYKLWLFHYETGG